MLVEKEVTLWSIPLKLGLSPSLSHHRTVTPSQLHWDCHHHCCRSGQPGLCLLESGELPRMEFALPLRVTPSSPALPSRQGSLSSTTLQYPPILRRSGLCYVCKCTPSSCRLRSHLFPELNKSSFPQSLLTNHVLQGHYCLISLLLDFIQILNISFELESPKTGYGISGKPQQVLSQKGIVIDLLAVLLLMGLCSLPCCYESTLLSSFSTRHPQ